jgi:ABC-type polysaccharide/polyol phosphate transport system ATPase subunit
MAKIQLDRVSVSYFIRRSSVSGTKFERGAVGAPITVGGRYLEIAALQDVSLSLQDGDRVGLVGANGSGKSTLLRLCAGGLAAKSGNVSIEGIVSPQFALGTGLRLELSGRQNAQLKCLYMNVPQSQIADQIEEVKNISELGGYFELPLQSYSAGMKSRFVMSLLRLVKGEILIMDEWINVADSSIGKKVGGLQAQLIEKSKILMLASHSARILHEWVETAIWIDQGRIQMTGPVDEVLAAYNSSKTA